MLPGPFTDTFFSVLTIYDLYYFVVFLFPLLFFSSFWFFFLYILLFSKQDTGNRRCLPLKSIREHAKNFRCFFNWDVKKNYFMVLNTYQCVVICISDQLFPLQELRGWAAGC
jgi:hypothetical protein